MKALINNQRGTSAVEFAIVLPLLVVFIFGIIEFGLVFYNKAMVTNASREAARAGIVYRDPPVTAAEIQSVVDSYCGGMLVSFGSSPGAVTTVPSGECANHGDELVVNVAYRYDFLLIPDFLTAFFSGGLPGGIDVSAVTRMRCE
ncbi:MAG: pilus assembly protein [Desulfobacterales bacterium]